MLGLFWVGIIFYPAFVLKAVSNRYGFGERIHCNNNTAQVESILRSKGLGKRKRRKKRRLLSHEAMYGRKTKQEPRATLVEHFNEGKFELSEFELIE